MEQDKWIPGMPYINVPLSASANTKMKDPMSQGDIMTNAKLIERLDARVEKLEQALREARERLRGARAGAQNSNNGYLQYWLIEPFDETLAAIDAALGEE